MLAVCTPVCSHPNELHRTVYMLALTCTEHRLSSQKQPRLHSQISTKTKDSPLDYHQTLPVPLAVVTFGAGEEGPDVILKLTLKVISIIIYI